MTLELSNSNFMQLYL